MVAVSLDTESSVFKCFVIEKPNVNPSLPTVSMYTASLPIKSAKFKDLQKLNKFISDEAKLFYQSLFSIQNSEGNDSNDEIIELDE